MPEPLAITGIDHVSVLITDLTKARDFYGGLLGLREMAKPKTFDFVVLWYDLGHQQLHLLQKPEPDTISVRHFALRVKSVAGAREYLQSRGVPFDETVKIPDADRIFINDPDGTRIELIEWQQPYDPIRIGAKELDR